ncbi:MAG: SLC13/DASS family transporter [Proteobacteria bacterium]|nr:SLC13/DASS family transporter [Pseudomonadota bacterium]
MTYEQTTLFIILGLAMAAFIYGRWRYDLVAFSALLAAVILGIVPSGQAFLGFGHPATITVAAVLILSRALSNSGAVDILADRLKPATRSPTLHIGTLLGIGAPLSAIMNNVGALSLLMPVAVQSAIKAKRSPATVLMPLSFGTILGGLVTLIGTPPNIIIATYRGRTVGEPFGMFDFTPVGAATALTGLLFITLIGWRLIPRSRRVLASQEEVFRIEDYIAEAKITEDSDSIGRSVGDMDDLAREQDVVIIGIIRGDIRIFAAARHQLLRPDDILVLEGGPTEIDKFVNARASAFDQYARLGCPGFDHTQHLFDGGADVEVFLEHVHLADFDFRDVEQVVDQIQQVRGAFVDVGRGLLVLLRSKWSVEFLLDHSGEADDGVQRGAKFVAHVGQKLGLAAVGVLRLFLRRRERILCALVFGDVARGDDDTMNSRVIEHVLGDRLDGEPTPILVARPVFDRFYGVRFRYDPRERGEQVLAVGVVRQRRDVPVL